MYSVKSLVSLFTDHFRKDPESHTYKLTKLFSEELQTLKATNDRMLEWRDIDNAEGATLDNIGTNLQQARGLADDARYRIMLKTKIARNLSDGSINGLIRAISYVLQIDKKQIVVGELWRVLDYKAAIAIEEIPLENIHEAGLTSDEFEVILQSFVSAGVKLMLMASGGGEYLELSGNPYGFEVEYRITSRFRAGRVPGTIVTTELELSGNPYGFQFDYPVTSRFRTAPVAGAIVTAELELSGDPYGFDVNYPVTSRFKTDKKAGIITSSPLPDHRSYEFEVPTRVTGRFRAGGRK